MGRVRAPWGLLGDLKVELHTDLTIRFSPGSILYLDGRPVHVERSRAAKNGLLVKLDVASDRAAAESLRGRFLTVPRQDVKPLPEASYYYFQIIEMGVWSEQGEFLGNIHEILTAGGSDVYVVRGEGRKELLIPAVDEVILEVDLEANRMTVRPPEGLS